MAVSSCTTALHLSLIVAGVGPGDEVIVPSFSFIATTNAVVYIGANPVFADVDAATGNLTRETVQAALTPQTKAVILVHQAGIPADASAMRAICEPRGIVVIEDAACAAGSKLFGRQVAGTAAIAAWSFHPRKLITTGEGGMLTTATPEWASRAPRMREHAMSASAAERHLSTLPAAEEYLELGFNLSDDRPAGGDGVEPSWTGCRRSCSGVGRLRRSIGGLSPASGAFGRLPIRPMPSRTLDRSGSRCGHRSRWTAKFIGPFGGPPTTFRRAAASWQPTDSLRTRGTRPRHCQLLSGSPTTR